MKILSNKPLLCTLLCMAVSLTAFAQQKDKYPINQLNKEGKKEGLWIGTEHSVYYENGKMNGVFSKYSDGSLFYLGEYTNNIKSGTWYSFNRNHLSWIMSQFDTNSYLITKQYCGEYVPDFKCVCRRFHLNGALQSEATILWDDGDDPENIFSIIFYGPLRIYDDQNRLISVDLFLDGETKNKYDHYNETKAL